MKQRNNVTLKDFTYFKVFLNPKTHFESCKISAAFWFIYYHKVFVSHLKISLSTGNFSFVFGLNLLPLYVVPLSLQIEMPANGHTVSNHCRTSPELCQFCVFFWNSSFPFISCLWIGSRSSEEVEKKSKWKTKIILTIGVRSINSRFNGNRNIHLLFKMYECVTMNAKNGNKSWVK